MCGIAGSRQDRIVLCIKDVLPCPNLADPRLQGHRIPAQATGRVVVGHFEFPELAGSCRSAFLCEAAISRR
jgi:hypothetical protein